MFTANKKPDVENAADAKMPGDKKEDAKGVMSSRFASAKKAAAPLVAKKLAKGKKSPFPPKK